LDSKDTRIVPLTGQYGSIVKSPKYFAVSIDITEVVTRLLSAGADVSTTGPDGVPLYERVFREKTWAWSKPC
jgi:hypothetical protein